MAGEKPDVDPFLAMIEARIAAWQAVADRYRMALAVESGQSSDIDVGAFVSQSSGTRNAASGPVELPTGAFRDKGIVEAIKVYLAAAKRKQTFKQISIALIDGGLQSTADDFDRTLNATLHRLKRAGVLLQFKDGWDLAAAYPEGFRSRLAKDKDEEQPTRKRKTSNRKRKKGKAKARRKKPAKPAPVPKVAAKGKNKKKAETDAPAVAPAA